MWPFKKVWGFFLLGSLLFVLGGCGGESSPSPSPTPQPPAISIISDAVNIRPNSSISFNISVDDAAAKVECDFNGDGSFEIDVTGSSGYSYKYETLGFFSVTCKASSEDNLSSISNALTIIVANQLGDIIKIIPSPVAISGVSDVVFDSASQSLLVFAYDENWEVTKIIQLNSLSGATLNTTPIVNPDFFMNHASKFTKAGDYYYGTSYGWSNGIPQSVIYKIDLNGNIISSFPCPASNTGGFCEGLAWDGQYLWSGASDNKNLTQFSINGTVYSTLTVLDSIGSHDVSYDKSTQQLIVSLDNNLNRFNPVTGAEINNIYTGFSRVGDWDGHLFWAVNSSAQQLEGIYIGD